MRDDMVLGELINRLRHAEAVRDWNRQTAAALPPGSLRRAHEDNADRIDTTPREDQPHCKRLALHLRTSFGWDAEGLTRLRDTIALSRGEDAANAMSIGEVVTLLDAVEQRSSAKQETSGDPSASTAAKVVIGRESVTWRGATCDGLTRRQVRLVVALCHRGEPRPGVKIKQVVSSVYRGLNTPKTDPVRALKEIARGLNRALSEAGLHLRVEMGADRWNLEVW